MIWPDVYLIVALFSEWTSFWSAYQRELFRQAEIARVTPLDSPARTEPVRLSASRAKLVDLVHCGCSATAAAKMLGISTGTAIAWLAQAGISVKTRPKSLLLHLREQARLRLGRGEDKEMVAKAIGVSIETITRLLFAQPGLHDKWEKARFSAAQTKARKKWTSAMQSVPHAASNQWRLLAPAAYAWLYRNDKLWLSETIRHRSVPVRRHSTRVNWELRDERLERLIVETVGARANVERSSSFYTVVELCTLVPLLRRHVGNLQLLPRTLRSLSFFCKRRPTAHLENLPMR